ncbi:hypothetical protein PFISCL1PPCAC_1942 [Pristionchus fissidentatus]|uniref:Exonuclease domain-containing protein n=1 Tax=Pristionchus fissidentatus TaxID=1538716 RepID=A0AAV5UWU0_9BILA|nr:hypothetical protein PFISCL1PPCAC_1942 [Pristionchus fissidentatus]
MHRSRVMNRNRKNQRFHNKMKKQIAELLLVGQQPEDVEQALNESISSSDGQSSSMKPEKDMGQMVSRKLAASRKERQIGPEIFLTLNRLGGFMVSHQEIADVVHYSVIGSAVRKPRWCNVRPWKGTSQTILMRVNCPSRFIETEGEAFPTVDEFFDRQWIKMDEAIDEREEFWKNILNVPVPLQQQIRERMRKLETSDLPKGDLKVDMLLSYADMADIGFPFPDDCELIVATKDKYSPVSASSPLFALDCEMCLTDAGMHELTRVSIVREDGSVLLDSLVKPTNRITDYLTKYSGITPALLDPVTVTLKDVQNALRACLPPDAILVGHSLEFDMRALRMAHPYCLDIGSLYNISGNSKKRTGLKTLSSIFLDADIQDESGHCSVVDAVMTMRLLEMKIERGLIFGNVMYGWSYDEFLREEEDKVKRQGEKKDENNEPSKKRKRSGDEKRDSIRVCECGQPLGVVCIVDECQCKISPPSKCVICLNGEKEKEEDKEKMTIDWSASVKPKEVVSSRPLSFYLAESKKNVMNAIEPIEMKIPTSDKISIRSPSSFSSPSQFFSSTSMEILEYALSLFEYSYKGDTPTEKGTVQLEMDKIDSMIQQVLSGAAKFALIVVILSSEKTSICYTKIKR